MDIYTKISLIFYILFLVLFSITILSLTLPVSKLQTATDDSTNRSHAEYLMQTYIIPMLICNQN